MSIKMATDKKSGPKVGETVVKLYSLEVHGDSGLEDFEEAMEEQLQDAGARAVLCECGIPKFFHAYDFYTATVMMEIGPVKMADVMFSPSEAMTKLYNTCHRLDISFDESKEKPKNFITLSANKQPDDKSGKLGWIKAPFEFHCPIYLVHIAEKANSFKFSDDRKVTVYIEDEVKTYLETCKKVHEDVKKRRSTFRDALKMMVYANNIPKDATEELLLKKFPGVDTIHIPTFESGKRKGFAALKFKKRDSAIHWKGKKRLSITGTEVKLENLPPIHPEYAGKKPEPQKNKPVEKKAAESVSTGGYGTGGNIGKRGTQQGLGNGFGNSGGFGVDKGNFRAGSAPGGSMNRSVPSLLDEGYRNYDDFGGRRGRGGMGSGMMDDLSRMQGGMSRMQGGMSRMQEEMPGMWDDIPRREADIPRLGDAMPRRTGDFGPARGRGDGGMRGNMAGMSDDMSRKLGGMSRMRGDMTRMAEDVPGYGDNRPRPRENVPGRGSMEIDSYRTSSGGRKGAGMEGEMSTMMMQMADKMEQMQKHLNRLEAGNKRGAPYPDEFGPPKRPNYGDYGAFM